MLVIHPDECIDCALCESECPANAIYSQDELPAIQSEFLILNLELSQFWKNITEVKLPLADADEWKDKPYKRELLKRFW